MSFSNRSFFLFPESFCKDPFWDPDLTWYTHDPDFTDCFQQTALVWGPCFILWLMMPIEAYQVNGSRFRIRRWTWISTAKISLSLLLTLLSMLELFLMVHFWRTGDRDNIPDVALITPVVKIATFILSAYFIFLDKRRARPSSALLFLFWLILALASLVTFRSKLREYPTGSIDLVSFIVQILYFPLIVIQFVLSCCAEKFPELTNGAKNPFPEIFASFLNRATFWWLTPLIYTGWKRSLTRVDLWDLQPEDKSQYHGAKLQRNWEAELDRKTAKNTSVTSVTSLLSNAPRKPYTPSLTKALVKTFWPTLAGAAVLRLSNDIFIFIAPSLLKLLIGFISNTNEESWKGYVYAAVMSLGSLAQVFFLAHYFVISQKTGMHIRSAVVAQVYAKALKMSAAAKRSSTIGEIVNLMAVDTQRFMDLMSHIQLLWSAPLQIAIGLFLLWREMGIAAMAGLVTMILLIPFNGFIASRTKALQISQMKEKDGRIKLMNEILNGMKILKLYAWEESFENQVLGIRNRELRTLRKAAYLNCLSSFIMQLSPFIVAITTFTTFVLIDEKNVLDAEKAFVSLSLFNVLRRPLALLPDVVTALIQANVSVQRVTKFLLNEELDLNSVRELPDHEKKAVIITGGHFSWGKNEPPVLNDVNLSIDEGSLVAVVGQVGSGKTSLCASMLGLVEKLGGDVGLKGKIAYVTQQAWIQNMTLKDNILFGKPFDQRRYDRVLEACALKQDLDMLPGGDLTEIGEKGINLSGGQKQRVSLARAVYSGADIYFLDDPLSAVDAHVGKHIFQHVIGPNGILKDKTRILVTHGIGFLPQTDLIIVLADGKISETGTYRQLLHDNGAFADFLRIHLVAENSDVDIEDPEDEAIKNEILGEIGLIPRPERAPSVTSGASTASRVRKVLRQDSRTLPEAKTKDSNGHVANGTIPLTTIKSKKNDKGQLVEIEKSELGGVKWSVYLLFLRQMTWLVVAGIFVFYILSNTASIGTNIWLGEWADDSNPAKMATKVNNTDLRDFRLGVYGALGTLQGIFILLSALTLAFGQVLASQKQHAGMLKRIMRAPMSFFDTTPLGRIVNRFSKDVDYVDTTIPTNFRMYLNCIFQVLFTVIVICYTTPIFGVVVVPLGILYYIVQRFFIPTSRQLKRLESVSRSPIYSHFQESISGASVIVAQRQVDRFLIQNERLVDYNNASYLPTIVCQRWLAVRVEFIGICAVFFAGLFAVIGRNKNWGINAKDIGLSISYALNVTQILNMMVRVASDLEANIVSVERIKEYSEVPQEADWIVENKRPDSSWPQQGHIVFDNYQTRYRPELDLVLTGVSCDIRSGEKVGIVGRTGAGKSSLTLALFRIIEPASGAIIIDGLNIADMGLHDLRSHLTIIPQEPVLFSGTIRMNLDPFGSYSDDDIWRALDNAHLRIFISTLPDGLEHKVAEGGENLSVGQRQLICLARALLRKTKILILDEATAAIDLETDALIQHTIRNKFGDCTILTIAHRLNTILDSTRVMVLDQGAVKELASPASLLADRNSIFYGLARSANLAS